MTRQRAGWLIPLALALLGAWAHAGTTPSRQVLFDLDEPLLRGRCVWGRLVVGDISGDGKRDLALVSKRDSCEGHAGLTLWILERRADGFAVGYEQRFPRSSYDIAVGNPDRDGRSEVLVWTGDWSKKEGHLSVIGCAPDGTDDQKATYSEESCLSLGPYVGSLRCIRLFDQTLIAAGGMEEVRFFRWTGSTYAEVADRRIDLVHPVTLGETKSIGRMYGLVVGIAPVESTPRRPRLALAVRNVYADTGGGAVVVLAWHDGWKVDAVRTTIGTPNALAAGDLIPGRSPELVVAVDDLAGAGGTILYQDWGRGWAQEWRRGRFRETGLTGEVAGLAFANEGRVLAIAENAYETERQLLAASVDLYAWEPVAGVARQLHVPFDRRLLALAAWPQWEQDRDALVVVEEGGIGTLVPVPAPPQAALRRCPTSSGSRG